MTLGRLQAHFGVLWGHFGVTLGDFQGAWGHFLFSKMTLDDLASTLGQVLVYESSFPKAFIFIMDFNDFMKHWGVIGLTWGHLGVTLGTL